MRPLGLIVCLSVLCFWAAGTLCQETELTGTEIMVRVDTRDDGDDQVSRSVFRLINRRGQERVRDTMRYWKDYDGREDFDTKTMVFFLSPPDVKDTGFLNWSYMDPEKDDDQWLYLPALRKVRRISAHDKEKAFMGTDFTFDDMGDRLVEEDEHSLVGTEEYRGKEHLVVESVPKKKDYLYSKKIQWVDAETWVVPKVDYYDRKERHLKTLEVEWQLVDGIWTWKRAEMRNHLSGHKTIVEIQEVKINEGYEDDTFTKRTIEKGL